MVDPSYVNYLIDGGPEVIKEEILECKRCPLHETVINKVIGKGSGSPKVLFVGVICSLLPSSILGTLGV